MTLELRRFNVWDWQGRLYILVESAPVARDVHRNLIKTGASSFATLTGAEAIPGPGAGDYRIPKLGLRVSEIKPLHLPRSADYIRARR